MVPRDSFDTGVMFNLIHISIKLVPYVQVGWQHWTSETINTSINRLILSGQTHGTLPTSGIPSPPTSYHCFPVHSSNISSPENTLQAPQHRSLAFICACTSPKYTLTFSREVMVVKVKYMLFLQCVYPTLFSRGSRSTLQPALSLQSQKG